ncbi:cysteine desulfurase [Myxococcota bacterium]|nr:cysteine desulfurase [Myxococcota bacterium]
MVESAIRQNFPALWQEVRGKPLVYLDSAATTQKPRAVIAAVRHFYESDCANVHRGVHALSQRATSAYEGAREKIRAFIGAESTKEIIFVKGATEAINLVAQTYGRTFLNKGDEIVLTTLEHHANIVPWQILRDQIGIEIKVAPLNELGEVDIEAYQALLGPKTRLVALGHVSNALGTINPIKEMIEMAHNVGALALIDGAQALPHTQVDVEDLEADFYVFSAHKLYGPTGIGVLYGRKEILESMPPYQAGGDMILNVTFEKTTYNELPYKFEAGTPNIAGVIGFGAAIDYLSSLGMDNIAAHEHRLLSYATQRLEELDGLRIIGKAKNKAAVISFVFDTIHPHDIGTIVDRSGVAIRTGHHCAQPVMKHFGVPATARASFGVYNSMDDVDALVEALQEVIEVFK